MGKLIARVAGVIFTALVVMIAMGLGWSMVTAGRAESTLATAPLTALGDLDQIEPGTRVRVQATAIGEPALAPPSGEQLALQYVRIEHTEGSGDDEETVVDYEYIAPVELLVSDGNEVVRVKAQHVDPRFLREDVSENMDGDGKLSAAASNRLDPIFNDIPGVPGGAITVRSIASDAVVTIYGTVVMEDGQPVIEAPDDGQFFVISALPFDQLVDQAQSSSTINMIFGWLLIILPPLVVAWLVWRSQRERRSVRMTPAVQSSSSI